MDNFKNNFGGIYFEYDDKGRVIHIIKVNYLGAAMHTYLQYDGKGRLSLVRENEHKTSYEYDDQDRLICEYHVDEGISQRNIAFVKYEYCDTFITKTIKDRMCTRIFKFDYKNRIISDTCVYKDGSGCETKFEYNDDIHMVTAMSYTIRDNVWSYIGSSEYPILEYDDVSKTDDERKYTVYGH